MASAYSDFYRDMLSNYANLGQQVQGQIAGVGASQSQAINDAYAQLSGQSTQDLASRGLGNTTVTSSVARGNEADRQKAQTALANQLAQLQAGYTAQLGSSALNFAGGYQQQQEQFQHQQSLAQQQYGYQQDLSRQQFQQQAQLPSVQYGYMQGAAMRGYGQRVPNGVRPYGL